MQVDDEVKSKEPSRKGSSLKDVSPVKDTKEEDKDQVNNLIEEKKEDTLIPPMKKKSSVK